MLNTLPSLRIFSIDSSEILFTPSSNTGLALLLLVEVLVAVVGTTLAGVAFTTPGAEARAGNGG
jgi:hypothetical protein